MGVLNLNLYNMGVADGKFVKINPGKNIQISPYPMIYSQMAIMLVISSDILPQQQN
jgi:hypothetical protein